MASRESSRPASGEPQTRYGDALVHAIAGRTRGDEDRATPIEGLLFFRRERLTEPCACLVEPSLVMVAQGAKQMLVGNEAYP